MTAIRQLTEQEMYLVAILKDPSGIELAEFSWVDEEKESKCYRLWPFQWPLYRNTSTYQIDWLGRSLGKSQGIIMRCCAFVFNYPGQEMLVTAPELNHLRPITEKVEHLVKSKRLLREMLPNRQGNGINHQPHFGIHFINNARIVSRLPNRDGRGVKGQHPLVIESDEMQDYPQQGWLEIIETMKAGSKGAQWRVHGVSRGTRDKFYTFTMGEDPNIPFYVHRYSAQYRPTWSDKEREQKISMYGGSEDNVDYKRNIFGDHGDVTNPLFVLARLMACVRINEDSWANEYNDEVYSCIKVNDEFLRSTKTSIDNLITLPYNHLDDQYYAYYGGLDFGATSDPTEILIFGETKKQGHAFNLRLLLRLQLMRISAEDQAAAVRHVFDFYGSRLKTFTLDKTGNGLPLYQMLNPEAVGTWEGNRTTPKHIMDRIKGYGFSQKIAVDFDDRPLEKKETHQDAVIMKNVVDWASDELRKIVDAGNFELPYDKELLSELQGQEVQYVKDEGSAGGRKYRYSGGSLHTLDAMKMMIAGRNLEPIEQALKPKKSGPVLDQFF